MTNGTSTFELTLRPATNRGVRSLVDVLVVVGLVSALLLSVLLLARGAGPPF